MSKAAGGFAVTVMLANHSSGTFHYWCGKYPGVLGWLVGPTASRKTRWRKWVPFALDNDAYSAFTNAQEWCLDSWLEMLRLVKSQGQIPQWCLCPDVVGDKQKTIHLWEKHSKTITGMGWAPAFAVQDGMEKADVPQGAEVIFVGGTTVWKWRTVEYWCSNFRRVHVGRVNTVPRLWLCEDLGAESVDGTSWFRDGEDGPKLQRLEAYLKRERHPELFLNTPRLKP